MNIAILGFGNVGSKLATLWSAAGHSLRIGLRAGSKSEEAARKLNAQVLEPAEAVRDADAVFLALPWTAIEGALQSVGSLTGRVILDATNPLTKDLRVIVPPAGSGAEQVAAWSGGNVVKAFNTIGAAYMGDKHFDGLYCGDDAHAKQVAIDLIKDTGMRPTDAGPLKNAVFLEHLAGLWIDLAVNQRVIGPFGFNLVRAEEK